MANNGYQPRRGYTSRKTNYAPRGGDAFANARPVSKAPTPPPAAPEKKAPLPQKIEGDPHAWVTIQKVTDPNSGWVKTTRAMQAAGGLLINTCSRKKGSTLCAEALCFVPGAQLVTVGNSNSVK